MTVGRRGFLASALARPAAAAGTGRIDCQSHIYSSEFLTYLERRRESPLVYRENGQRFVRVNTWVRKLMPGHTDLSAKLAAMDASHIAMAALSINDPGPELFGSDAPAIAVELNDFISDCVARHPKRFFGLATLPFNTPETTVREFDRILAKPGMLGVLLYSNLAGIFPDAERLRPFFLEAQRRHTPVVLHPAHPMTMPLMQDYQMSGGLGLMFDTTIALTRMIVSGMLEELPNLRLVCPHVGGALPYLIGRIDHQTTVLKRGSGKLREPPSAYLKRVWLDSVSPSSLAVRFARDFAGPDKLLYGSDHPWVDPALIVRHVDEAIGDPGERAKLYAENARRLFGISEGEQK